MHEMRTNLFACCRSHNLNTAVGANVADKMFRRRSPGLQRLSRTIAKLRQSLEDAPTFRLTGSFPETGTASGGDFLRGNLAWRAVAVDRNAIAFDLGVQGRVLYPE